MLSHGLASDPAPCYLTTMSAALHAPTMTRDQFLAWAQGQNARHEFAGGRPVAMTGGSLDHNRICQNLYFALRTQLRDGPCEPLGPDAGLATTGDNVRYPDALVTCTRAPGADQLTPGVLIVFEVVSPASSRLDRIIKVREYRAVLSIRRYVIIEQRSVGATVLARNDQSSDWTARALVAGDAIELPEIGLTLPLDDLYAGTDVPQTGEPP